MPGNIQAAAPTDVMPAGLCASFTEELRIELNVNAYPNGESDRAALALNARHFFRLTRPVITAAQYTALRDFYNSHRIDPFYFYVLRETVPPWTWDPTGGSTVGRYTVVFDGSWSDQVNMGRSAVSVNLREVA